MPACELRGYPLDLLADSLKECGEDIVRQSNCARQLSARVALALALLAIAGLPAAGVCPSVAVVESAITATNMR
jgi:hypothetical protein